MKANIEAFYDEVTGTVSYVVYDRQGGQAAIVDPVLDFDPRSGRTGTRNADRLVDFVRGAGLKVSWILETHAHADHLSGAHYLREELGGLVAIGNRIGQVQVVFKALFNLDGGFPTDGSQFDHQFDDGEKFRIGELEAEALYVPGHTPACVAYRIGTGADAAVFLGDTMFMPDIGTARCDFPGGDARTLYRSIRRLLALPGSTRLYMCHDYPPPDGRAPAWVCTVDEKKAGNIHVHDGIDEAGFVAMRTARDRTLEMPKLIIASIQVNIRAGAMPEPEANGVRYLKMPVNVLG
jgi:glyoxylase-like metal-dependent hydrolase (beta-lactamase superfamily II)